MIEKVLVANRGEIALRVMRACRELGIRTVAVHSTIDADSLHVKFADESVCIGGHLASDSYLNIPRVMAAAEISGADAIHPGYGFLAENAEFADIVTSCELTWIGPSAEIISRMGDKNAARMAAIEAGVPVVPGSEGLVKDADEAVEVAETIGYPVMVKAVAGGGGKGMRPAFDEEQLRSAVVTASNEAQAAFKNGDLYLEKLVQRPRHVEVQILGDLHGNILHLGERDCSIQRRHQKLIEEAPSPAVDEDLRRRMGEAAVRLAKAVDYSSAGTIEFLLDEDGNFYFMEMNTRIQVEHPVTECVTGVDLVKRQIRIARGEPLDLVQAALRQRGHAIECRIYAEDPARGFMPSSGKILLLREPSGPGIRNDTGIFEGYEVSTHYDPILAKLVAWDEDREGARRKMLTALENYVILGIETPILFLRDVLDHPAFIEGKTHTDFIPLHFKEWSPEREGGKELPLEVLAAAALSRHFEKVPAGGRPSGPPPTPWTTVGHWEIGGGA